MQNRSVFIVLLNLSYVCNSSGGFQLSPDFRARASSNASSCGRLSPIPSVIDLEPSWTYGALGPDYDTPGKIQSNAQNATLDQLAGVLQDELTLQNDFMQG